MIDTNGIPTEDLRVARELFTLDHPLLVEMQPRDAWVITAVVQFAARNPQLSDAQRRIVVEFGRGLQAALVQLVPASGPVIEKGWHAEYDVAAPARVVEVHNVWTIYGLNEDGSEADDPLAELHRPQDWGNPRWHYEEFTFEWAAAAQDDTPTRYVNHFHGWTDLKRERHEYPELFSSLLTQIMIPGSDPRVCGREYLQEDDFWNKAWGPQPPYLDEDDQEDEE